jgi:hypothetical protein
MNCNVCIVYVKMDNSNNNKEQNKTYTYLYLGIFRHIVKVLLFVVSTKYIDAWDFEFVVSNTTDNNNRTIVYS